MKNYLNKDDIILQDESSKLKRYELKYTITENLASEIRDFIQDIFTKDKNVPPGESGYIVNNLYFDTPNYQFYYDTKFRKLTRYKPRVRYYGKKADGLIWPEIKFRNVNTIWKQRFSMPAEEWHGLTILHENGSKNSTFKSQLETFQDVIYWHQAEPILHVQYHREPYVTELESYGRITLDRHLRCRNLHGEIGLDYDDQEMCYYDDPITSKSADSLVVLEIKVETMVPYWTVELIRKFKLVQRGYSKYCYGIDSILDYFGEGRIPHN